MLMNREVKSHCLFAREMTPNKNELLVADSFRVFVHPLARQSRRKYSVPDRNISIFKYETGFIATDLKKSVELFERAK